MKEKQNRLSAILIIAIIIIIALIISLFLSIKKTREQDKELAVVETYFQEEKKELNSETEQIVNEIEGYKIYIHSDSIKREFELQKQKIKELQRELKNTKISNKRRIVQLKSKISTLRKLVKHYVRQIDSLNKKNKRLLYENRKVKRKYASIAATAEQLEKEKEDLSQVVNRASILETYNFKFTPLNKRQRKTKRAKKIRTFKFSFTIGKNITTPVGIKKVYLRITKPDSEVMIKSDTLLFDYENKKIAYSIMKEIEYTGEAYNDIMYWNVEEIVQVGEYQADFFVDGNRIGSYSFRINKK